MSSAAAVAAGLQAIGSLVSGFGSFQASRARAAALTQSAAMARRDASMEAGLAADDAERAAAQAVVRGAAAGGGGSGSFQGVLENLERTGTFNARSAIWAGETEARNRLYEAKVAKVEGNYALLGSMFQAGSSIAGGFAREAEGRKQQTLGRRLYVSGRGR